MKYITVPHIRVPTYHYLEKYGYPKGTIGIGIAKRYVDQAIKFSADLKVSYGKSSQKYVLKRSQTQDLPVQRGFGRLPDIIHIPANILQQTSRQKKLQEAEAKYQAMTPEERFYKFNR